MNQIKNKKILTLQSFSFPTLISHYVINLIAQLFHLFTYPTLFFFIFNFII